MQPKKDVLSFEVVGKNEVKFESSLNNLSRCNKFAKKVVVNYKRLPIWATILYFFAAYCPYKWQQWGMDKCLWMTELDGRDSEAVRRCTHRNASLPVIEDADQNSDLQTKLAYGDKTLLPLGCITGNNTDGQWICNNMESSEWFWNHDESKGYWSK